MDSGGWLGVMKGVSCLVAVLAAAANIPTRYWMPAQRATLQYLADAPLDDMESKRQLKAGELWAEHPVVVMAVRRPGCLLCREAAHELSELKRQLDVHRVGLVAVVHETLGVDDFKPFFKGPVFLDRERRFYGPRERWMLFSGIVRPSTWLSGWRASRKGFSGNMKGEGRLLGGVFVIGAGHEGILFDHRESEWGDHANLTEVLAIVQNMKAPTN